MGQILLLSDIHANVLALEWVLKDVRTRATIDEVWFLGDLLGYGPHPLEVIDRVRSEEGLYQEAFWLVGNHDVMLKHLLEVGQVSPEPPRGQSPVAWASWREHYARLQESEQRDWYQHFLEQGRGPRLFARNGWQVILTHGTLIRGEKRGDLQDAIETYGFPWLSEEFNRYYFLSPLDDRMLEQRCIVLYGHTHVPTCRVAEGKNGGDGVFTERLLAYEEPLSLRGAGCVLLNPGSVGFPRDGDPRASYAVLDLEAEEVTFYRVPYPQREVAAVLAREQGWYELARRVMEGTLPRSPEQIGDYMAILERRKQT